ncbi:hypothetical protein [Pedobacter heparinus]|uniref:hypothetical protein n=1 Tax=Pedobacter heparinus TaxID=984 RepID=UPI00293117BA|nr:hypothetical protein [Pedobacter heparinus]
MLGIVVFFSSFTSAEVIKITGQPIKILKSARWMNYPYAINGQIPMSFCGDVVNESTVVPESSLSDQDEVCVGYSYHFSLPFTCAAVTWHVYNGSVTYSYSDYHKIIQFNNNIHVDGYANVWVDVIDPVSGDPYSYEFAFFPSSSCDQ